MAVIIGHVLYPSVLLRIESVWSVAVIQDTSVWVKVTIDVLPVMFIRSDPQRVK